MLVISRKQGEKITIGKDIEVVIISVKGKQAKIGIQAPKTYEVLRVSSEEKS